MVVPRPLAAFSALERAALQRARLLADAMCAIGARELQAKVELEDPPGGGGRPMMVEVSLSSPPAGRVVLRLLATRVQLTLEDLQRHDLFDAVDAGAFLPRGGADRSATFAGGPCSGAAREDTHPGLEERDGT